MYKYATGISAAIILSEGVLTKDEKKRDDYLEFLKRGGRLFPLENLKLAGADLQDKDVFKITLKRFETVLNALDTSI